jgi:hypothetical protein
LREDARRIPRECEGAFDLHGPREYLEKVDLLACRTLERGVTPHPLFQSRAELDPITLHECRHTFASPGVEGHRLRVQVASGSDPDLGLQ